MTVQIEIGPKEVEDGTCVLSVATDTPGVVGTRIPGLRQNSLDLMKQIEANGKFPWLKID